MLNLIKSKYLQWKNSEEKHICQGCVWYKAEEENNMPMKNHVRFCDLQKDYRASHDFCYGYIEEKFEAKPDSIQSPELDLNLDLEWSRND